MTAILALERARAVGVTFAVDGDWLLMEAPAKPPDEVLDLLRRHKPAIVALLRPAIVSGPSKYVMRSLDRIAKAPPRWDVPPDRWDEIVENVHRLAAVWDAQARRLGWRELDLYGLHPAAPKARYDARGLFVTVSPTDRIIAIADAAATIEKVNGSIVRYYRLTHDTDAVLAWDVSERKPS
jgi:hypothetical protein